MPRQHTPGGKPRLLGISKRGSKYLRTLLIHGARAALPCSFAVEQDERALDEAREGLNERQRTNLATLARLIGRSIDENRIFADYVMALSDQRKLSPFLGEERRSA